MAHSDASAISGWNQRAGVTIDPRAVLNKPEWTPLEEVKAFNPELMTPGTRLFKNSRYTVHYEEIVPDSPDVPTLIHLSIKNNENSAHHDWRDMQRLKNELVGPEEEGVELFPAESRLVDTSNQFHIWILKGVAWNFGFDHRAVTETQILDRQTQRPFEERPEDCGNCDKDARQRVQQIREEANA